MKLNKLNTSRFEQKWQIQSNLRFYSVFFKMVSQQTSSAHLVFSPSGSPSLQNRAKCKRLLKIVAGESAFVLNILISLKDSHGLHVCYILCCTDGRYHTRNCTACNRPNVGVSFYSLALQLNFLVLNEAV